MELLLYARARHNIDHFVIDSLMKLDLSGEDYDAQRAFLNDLTGFAIKTGCHVHLVAHPRKGSDEAARPGKLDIKGSSDIFNQVDNVVSVWRNKAKEDRRTTGKAEESEPDSIIYCDKQRLTGWEGSTRLWFDANSRQFRANYTENPKIYISALPSLEEIVSGMPELPPDPRMSDA
jgi:twinkle protein